MYLKVMTGTCKQTDIDKNVIWNQISAFLAIQLLLMANSPELAAKCINPNGDGQAVLRGNMIRALFTSCFDVTPGVNGVICNLHQSKTGLTPAVYLEACCRLPEAQSID